MKRNYKTFNVQTEAAKIINQLRVEKYAIGDSVAIDTVKHWVERNGINGKYNVSCDSCFNENAKFYLTD